jgi:hypothetical protein
VLWTPVLALSAKLPLEKFVHVQPRSGAEYRHPPQPYAGEGCREVEERRGLSLPPSDLSLVTEETQLSLALDHDMNTNSSDEEGSSLWREVCWGDWRLILFFVLIGFHVGEKRQVIVGEAVGAMDPDNPLILL